MEGLNLIAHNDLKNPATEAYRVIRTSIQFAQAGKELKTLAVTSCMPNEGKSMTAANLAVVLTQKTTKMTATATKSPSRAMRAARPL